MVASKQAQPTSTDRLDARPANAQVVQDLVAKRSARRRVALSGRMNTNDGDHQLLEGLEHRAGESQVHQRGRCTGRAASGVGDFRG